MEKSSAIVFVVDDDASVRKSLARLIKSVGLNVETFESAQAFLDYNHSDVPGCLILDMRMQGFSGLDLQKRLKAEGSSIPIVFLTGHGNVPTSVRAMKAGALDFLEKPVEEQALLDAIHRAIQKDKNRREENLKMVDLQQRFDALTPREREVFSMVVSGLLNKQIAFDLGIVEKTVKVHRAHVMEKMEAQSLADLVRMAERLAIHW